jgi:hypothetical protein
MGGPPICHAFIMVGMSFDISAILFYLAATLTNKQEDVLSPDGNCY